MFRAQTRFPAKKQNCAQKGSGYNEKQSLSKGSSFRKQLKEQEVHFERQNRIVQTKWIESE